jgi:hypothetical protein
VPPGPGPKTAPKAGPLVQYALLAGPLLSMLDSSIVNVAVEPIARELHASLTVVQWTVSGYLLALGAGLAGPAHRPGHRAGRLRRPRRRCTRRRPAPAARWPPCTWPGSSWSRSPPPARSVRWPSPRSATPP